MCILEDYRKRGIGGKLFSAFKEICTENNIKELKVIASYKNILNTREYRYGEFF